MSLHQTDNEKKRTAQPATILPPCYQVGKEATDLAVNRVSLDGEAPLTRGYLGGEFRPVNIVLQFYVVMASVSLKIVEYQRLVRGPRRRERGRTVPCEAVPTPESR